MDGRQERSRDRLASLPMSRDAPPNRRIASVDYSDVVVTSPAAINEAILQLQDHQERVQKKTFTNWVNSYLANHAPPRKITNLFEDIKDGVALLHLLETLSGETLASEKMANMTRHHHISNVTTALKFLETRKIKLVNIHPTDIVDGKPSIVLGLIWTIILYFQIEENTRLLARQEALALLESSPSDEQSRTPTATRRLRVVGAQSRMMDWVQQTMPTNSDVQITDFGKSWRDGIAFNHMIHGLRPDLVDIDSLAYNSARTNLENAFSTAEIHLGIPRLLDPEDVDVDKPDERSIMTYVAKFLEKFPERDSAKSVQLDPAAQELHDYEMLLNWLEPADKVLQASGQPVVNGQKEYQSYESFMADFQRNAALFERLSAGAGSSGLINITRDQWEDLKLRWTSMQAQAQQWHEKLDRSLPGTLGQLGDLFGQTEQLLEATRQDGETVSPELRMQQLQDTLQRLNESRDELHHAVVTGKYRGVPLSGAQLRHLEGRLGALTARAEDALQAAVHGEAKQKLLALLEDAEERLAGWNVKYGGLEEVKDIQEDCVSFIGDGQLFVEVDEAFQVLRKTADAFRRLDPQSAEAESVTRDMVRMFERWEQLKADLNVAKVTQADTVQSWASYNEITEQFQHFLADGGIALQKPLSEQETFFACIPSWESKLATLRGKGSQLVTVSDDSTAARIRTDLSTVDSQWQDMLARVKQAKGSAVESARSEYGGRLSRLRETIEAGERLLGERVEADHTQLAEHTGTLQNFATRKPDVEEDLSAADELTKTLKKESPKQVVDAMIEELSQTKQQARSLFSELANKEEVLRGKLPRVYSLNVTLSELTTFLERGIELLETSPSVENVDEIKRVLTTCKAYMSEIDDSAGVVENLAVEYQQLVRTGTQYLNSDNLHVNIEQISERTQDLKHVMPSHVAKLEIHHAHYQFAACATNAQVRLDAQRQELKTNGNADDAILKYKEAFEDDDVIAQAASYLATMNEANDFLLSQSDASQQELVASANQRWGTLSMELADFKVLLQDLPKQWKDYKERANDLQQYVAEMSSVVAKLNDENLSAAEYREAQAKFQELLASGDKYESEAKALKEILEKLSGLGGSADPDTSLLATQESFDKITQQLEALRPACQETAVTSSVVSESHDYKEKADGHVAWLRDVTAALIGQGETAVGDLDTARGVLAEHEAVRASLLARRAQLESDLAEGRLLAESGDAPGFVRGSVAELERALDEAIAQADLKCSAMQEKVKNLEEFHSTTSALKERLEWIERGADKPASAGSQEMVQRDIKSQQELREELDDLKAEMNRLTTLKESLGENITDSCREELQKEIDAIAAAIEDRTAKVEQRLQQLNQADEQWTEFHQQIGVVAQELSQAAGGSGEAKVKSAVDENASVEERLAAAAAERQDLIEQGKVLDELERTLGDLGQGKRTRETAAANAKLVELRRQWQEKMRVADGLTDSLTSDVQQLKEWHKNLDQLEPLLQQLDEASAHSSEGAAVQCDDLEGLLSMLAGNKALLGELEASRDVHASLQSVGDSLSHLPAVASGLASIDERWDGATRALQGREQQLEFVAATWKEHAETQKELERLLAEMEGKLGEVNGEGETVDIGRLKSRQENYEALAEHAKKVKPLLDKLANLQEKLKPFVSEKGLDKMAADQSSLAAKWQDVADEAQQKAAALADTQGKVQQFWGELGNLVNWTKATKSRVNDKKEIFSDEINAAAQELEASGRECEMKEEDFKRLEAAAMQLLANCTNDEERKIIEAQLDDLRSSFGDLRQTVEDKSAVVSEWARYNDTAKQTKEAITVLQRRMELPDLSPEELESIKSEIADLQHSLQKSAPTSGISESNGRIPGVAVKDRLSHKTLDVKGEFEALQKTIARADDALQRKKERQAEISALWSKFNELKSSLLLTLLDAQKKVDAESVNESSLEGIQAMEATLKQTKSTVSGLEPEYDVFKQLSQQLMLADKSHLGQIQEEVASVEGAWEAVSKALFDTLASVARVLGHWKNYAESAGEVGKALKSVQAAVEVDCGASSKEVVQQQLGKLSKIDADLTAQKRTLMNFVSQSSHLVTDVEQIPGFSVRRIQAETEQLMLQWDDATKRLKESRESLQGRVALWENVERSSAELEQSLSGTLSRLELQRQAGQLDAATVLLALEKYQTDLLAMTEIFVFIEKTASSLRLLNKNESIPALTAMEEGFREKFGRAARLASGLETHMSELGEERAKLGGAVQELVDWLSAIQDKLARTDEISGSDEDVLNRFNTTKAISKDLEGKKNNVIELSTRAAQLSSDLLSGDVTSIVKSLALVRKKFEAMLLKSHTIADTLQHVLQLRLETALQDFRDWLAAVKEKVTWISNLTGDKFSAEAKLEAGGDVKDSLPVGEEKLKFAAEKLELLKDVMEKKKREEFQGGQRLNEAEWKTLNRQLNEALEKLGHCLEQWKHHHDLEAELRTWVTEVEKKLQSFAELLPSREAKQERLARLTPMEADVAAHASKTSELVQLSAVLHKATSNERVTTIGAQTQAKHASLAASIKTFRSELSNGIKDHEAYEDTLSKVTEWIKSSRQTASALEANAPEDKPAARFKVDSIKNLVKKNDAGKKLFDSTILRGDKLFPSTTPDGRELIRRELRELAHQWESWTDHVTDLQQRAEQMAAQFDVFETRLSECVAKMDGLQRRIRKDIGTQNSVAEKEAVLLSNAMLSQEILSQVSAVEDIADLSRSLGSNGARNKAMKLTTKFEELRDKIQIEVKSNQQAVSAHAQYVEALEDCRQLVEGLRAKLESYKEPTSDKLELNAKLQKLHKLLERQNNSDAKFSAVKVASENIVKQTGADGRRQISNDLRELKSNQDRVINEVTTTVKSFEGKKLAWDQYDALNDELTRWLREMELSVKEHELRSSLDEKRAELKKLKIAQERCVTKKKDFAEIASKAQQFKSGDSQMLSHVEQLSSHYEPLLNQLKTLIGQCERQILEQEQFEGRYAASVRLLSELERRLAQCSRIDGDSAGVQEARPGLESLLSDKESASVQVLLTIELGEKFLQVSTTVEGKDILRHQIRSLKERWDRLISDLSDSQQHSDLILAKMATFEDNRRAFIAWLTEVEAKLETSLKATLKEKKIHLQQCRVMQQDIEAHEKVLDSLTEQSIPLTAASPTQVTHPARDVTERYSALAHKCNNLYQELSAAVAQHQKYKQAYYGCLDNVTALKAALGTASAGGSGDLAGLKSRLATVQTTRTQLTALDAQLELTSSLSDVIRAATSPAGHDRLNKDLKALRDDRDKLSTDIGSFAERLAGTIETWMEIEGMEANLTNWIKAREEQMKQISLRATAQEKMEQTNQLQVMQEGMTQKRVELDKYSALARSLAQTCNDSRAAKNCTKMTNRFTTLQNTTKDVVDKWSGFAANHKRFDEKLKQVTDWLLAMEEKLSMIADETKSLEGLHSSCQRLQALTKEKWQAELILNETLTAGDKLHASTSKVGRERIRSEQHQLRERWNSAAAELEGLQTRTETLNALGSVYKAEVGQLEQKLAVKEASLTEERINDERCSLVEKKGRLQKMKVLCQEMLELDKLTEVIASKIKTMSTVVQPSEFSSYNEDLKPKYVELLSAIQKRIKILEQQILEHSQYTLQLNAVKIWLQPVEDHLLLCDNFTGDKLSVENHFQHVEDIELSIPEGELKIKEFTKTALLTMKSLDDVSAKAVQEEVDLVTSRWHMLVTNVQKVKQRLRFGANQLVSYEEEYEKFLKWLKVMENVIKEDVPVSSVHEKRALSEMFANHLHGVQQGSLQLNNCLSLQQGIISAMSANQRILPTDSKPSQSAGVTTNVYEVRLLETGQQLTIRYNLLLSMSRNVLSRCEQSLEAHEAYNRLMSSSSVWLKEARARLSACSLLVNSRDEVEAMLERIQDLARSKGDGYAMLIHAVEAGENLSSTTSPDGREAIRSQNKSITSDFDGLFAEVLSFQRELDIKLVQWRTFEEGYAQADLWLSIQESSLRTDAPLCGSLDAKKLQLQTFQNVLEDLTTYQRVIDSVMNKAQDLSHSARDTVIKQMNKLNDTYSQLCRLAKERVETLEAVVKDHQVYSNCLSDFKLWIKNVEERFKILKDFGSDIGDLQLRLGRLENYDEIKKEGENKLSKTTAMSEKVIPSTLAEGQDFIFNDVKEIKTQLVNFSTDIAKCKLELRHFMTKTREFNELYEEHKTGMRSLEMKLRSIESQPTLGAKLEQLHYIRSLHEEEVSFGASFAELIARADALSKIFPDTQAPTMVLQLTNRLQMQSWTVKLLLTQWQQTASEHQAYDDLRLGLLEWYKDVVARLHACIPGREDAFSLGAKLAKLHEIQLDCGTGLDKLQDVLHQRDVVMLNTSSAGKDALNGAALELQRSVSALLQQLQQTRDAVEAAVQERKSFEAALAQLAEWLQGVEAQVHSNGGEHMASSTLPETKSRLDKIVGISKGLASKRVSVVNLNQQAKVIAERAKDRKDLEAGASLETKYNALVDTVKTLTQRYEKLASEFQDYQDSELKARDRLRTSNEKLSFCVNLDGDFHLLSSRRDQLQDLQSGLPEMEALVREASDKAGHLCVGISTAGQSSIHAEVHKLNNDMGQLSLGVTGKLTSLDKILQAWKEFDQSRDELDQWTIRTEVGVKDAQALRGGLEEKQTAASSHQQMALEISDKAASFGDIANKAELIQQSCREAPVVEQSRQLQGRYATLLTASADQTKRLQHNVEDHSHYLDAHQSFVTWLQTANQKLATCVNVVNSKEAAQTQLEQFYEILEMKEAGVMLLHSLEVYAKKTLLNTSLSGSTPIHDQVERCQHQWAAFVAAVDGAKDGLEASLLRWSEVEGASSRLAAWMGEVERRRQVGPASSLADKKAKLHKLKSLYKEVMSKEHSLTALTSQVQQMEADGNVDNPALAQIAGDYASLSNSIKAQLDLMESQVEYHVTYQESCEQFGDWLQQSKDKMLTCSDVTGDVQTVEEKLARIQSLEESLQRGRDLLEIIKQNADQILPDTSLPGRSTITHDVETLEAHLRDLTAELDATRGGLAARQGAWREYEGMKEEAARWLEEAARVQGGELPGGSAEEKERTHQERLRMHEEVLAQKGRMDALSRRLRELTGGASGGGGATEINDLLDKYNVLTNASTESVKKSEVAVRDQQAFDSALAEYSSLLGDAKARLAAAGGAISRGEQLESGLGTLADLESAMTVTMRAKLQALLERGNTAMQSTDPQGAACLKETLEGLLGDFEAVREGVAATRGEAERGVECLRQFEEKRDKVDVVMKKTAVNLGKEAQQKVATLEDKKAQIELLKALLAQIDGQTVDLDALQGLAARLPGSLAADGGATVQQWQTLRAEAQAQLDVVQAQVAEHQQYVAVKEQCREGLKELGGKLAELIESSCCGGDVESRLCTLKDMKRTLADLQRKYDEVAELGSTISLHTSEEGCELIRAEKLALREAIAKLEFSIERAEADLEAVQQESTEYGAVLEGLVSWLDEVEARIKSIEGKLELALLDQLGVEMQDVIDSFNLDTRLDELRTRSQSLAQFPEGQRMVEETNALAERFTALQQTVVAAKQGLDRLAQDHTAYSEACRETRVLLDRVAATLGENGSIEGDLPTVCARYEAIKSLTSALKDSDNCLQIVLHGGQTLNGRVPAKDQQVIEANIRALQMQYKALSDDVIKTSDRLHGWLDKAQRYKKLSDDLAAWLEAKRNEVKALPVNSGDLSKRRERLSGLMLQQAGLGERDEDFVQLTVLADKLDAAAAAAAGDGEEGMAAHKSDVIGLCRQLEMRKTRVAAKIELMEVACRLHEVYLEALHQCEDWLRGVADRLNAGAISGHTMESARTLLTLHKALVEEIAEYEGYMDELEGLGERMIEDNGKLPDFVEEIETQLSSVTQTYNEHKTCASDLLERLESAVIGWTEYAQRVDACVQYMDVEVTVWPLEGASVMGDTNALAQKIAKTENLLTTLEQMNAELQASKQLCHTPSAADLDDVTPSKEAHPMSSPFQQRADHASERMEEVIRGLRGLLSQLGDRQGKWREMETLKQDLIGWQSAKEKECEDLCRQPVKLSVGTAEEDVLQLTSLLTELQDRSPTLEKLVIRCAGLFPHSPAQAHAHSDPVRGAWEALVARAREELGRRRDLLAQTRAYDRRHEALKQAGMGLGEAQARLREADVPAEHRVNQLRGFNNSSQATQTALSVLRSSPRLTSSREKLVVEQEFFFSSRSSSKSSLNPRSCASDLKSAANENRSVQDDRIPDAGLASRSKSNTKRKLPVPVNYPRTLPVTSGISPLRCGLGNDAVRKLKTSGSAREQNSSPAASNSSSDGAKTRLGGAAVFDGDYDQESGYDDVTQSTEHLTQEHLVRNQLRFALQQPRVVTVERDSAPPTVTESQSLDNLCLRHSPCNLMPFESVDKFLEMPARNSNSSSLIAESSLNPRRHSITVERPVSVTFVNDSGSMEFLHQSRLNDTLNTSSFPSLADVTDWQFDTTENRVVNIPVQIVDDDRCISGEYLHSSRDLLQRASRDVIYSPDDSNDADVFERSAKYDMEVVEQEAIRISTVFIPNTALDDSDDGGNNEAVEQTQDGGFTEGPDFKFASDDAASCHSGLTELNVDRPAAESRESGTQTPRNRKTQTDVERETQTENKRSPMGHLNEPDNVATGHQLPSSVNSAREYMRHERDNSSDDWNSVHEALRRNEEHIRPVMQNFSQQTIEHNATQTPVFLRLDTILMPNARAGSVYVSDDGFGPDLRHLEKTPRHLDDEALDSVESRHFGTQTFGQMTNDDTNHAQTQTLSEGWSDQRETQDERSVNGHDNSPANVDVMSRHSGESEFDDKGRKPSDDDRRHKHYKDKKNKRERRSKRDSERSESSTVGSNSSSRMDLLKLMLHEVKGLKEQFEEREAGSKPERKRETRSHPNKHSSRHGEQGADEFHGYGPYARSIGYDDLPQGYKQPIHVRQIGRSRPRRHSVESYVIDRAAQRPREPMGHAPVSYFDRERELPATRRALTPPPRQPNPNWSEDYRGKQPYPKLNEAYRERQSYPNLNEDYREPYPNLHEAYRGRHPYVNRNEASELQMPLYYPYPYPMQHEGRVSQSTNQAAYQHGYQSSAAASMPLPNVQQYRQPQVPPNHVGLSTNTNMARSPMLFVPEANTNTGTGSQSYLVLASPSWVTKSDPAGSLVQGGGAGVTSQALAARHEGQQRVKHSNRGDEDSDSLNASLSKAEAAAKEMKHLTKNMLRKHGNKDTL